MTGAECDGVKYSICHRNRCYCKIGYYERNGKCMAELGEEAEDASHCESSVFRDGKCTCNYDQFNLPNMRQCIKNVAQVTFICTQESQCSPFGDAYCSPVSPRRCVCRDYAIYDESLQFCRKKTGFGRYCSQDQDCEGLDNTKCDTSRNVCGCADNYYEVDEKCRPGTGGECETADDCIVRNSDCVEKELEEEVVDSKSGRRISFLSKVEEGVESQDDRIGEIVQDGESGKTCQCKDKYVNYMNMCLEVAEKYGDTCQESEQCKPLLGDMAKCIDDRCVCDEDSHFNYDKCNEKKALGESCTKVSECYVAESKDKVQCRNAVCQCEFTYVPDSDRRKCIPSSSAKGKGHS